MTDSHGSGVASSDRRTRTGKGHGMPRRIEVRMISKCTSKKPSIRGVREENADLARLAVSR